MKSNKKAQNAAYIILMLLIIGSAVFLLLQGRFFDREAPVAVVAVDGSEKFYLPLGEGTEAREIPLEKDFQVRVTLLYDGGTVRFLDSDCPDKICINAGALSRDMDIAVCMPNRVSVVVMPLKDVKHGVGEYKLQ